MPGRKRRSIAAKLLRPFQRFKRRKTEAPIGQERQELEPQSRTFHDDHDCLQQSLSPHLQADNIQDSVSYQTQLSSVISSNLYLSDIATISPTPTTPSRTSSPLPLSPSETRLPTMASDRELKSLLETLSQIYTSASTQDPAPLLSRCKLLLLQLNALLPTPNTPPSHLPLARATLELGALFAIRARDTDAFVRYVQQLQPFYALPASTLPKAGGHASKITGLFLLLLLSQGDTQGFHMVLEALELSAEGAVEDDEYIQYPVRLERALMEGSYDRVWAETKGGRVPGEEFEVFSEVSI
jgi:CSN8/PSMD8/EIF3K family